MANVDSQTNTPHAADLDAVQNINVERTVSLTPPASLTEELPLSHQSHRTVLEGRRDIQRILTGEDPRMLVVAGPCSIHDEEAALDYAERLNQLREKVGDRMLLAMRVYFEKPRTTTGWKGLINDPHLNGSFDIQTGLRIARRLLGRLTEMGLPTATEMLDPITPQYIDDAICWAAIGARTTESQTHRQMASGLSMPIGFKNATDGRLDAALNAMAAAKTPHAFLGIDEAGHSAVVHTRGNPWGHLILRGGGGRSNYEQKDVEKAAAALADHGLPPAIMVDCSHANSGKKPERQNVAWRNVIEQRIAGNHHLVGLMLESNIVEGNQKLGEDSASLTYGQSITDACIGWDETEQLIHQAYDQLASIQS